MGSIFDDDEVDSEVFEDSSLRLGDTDDFFSDANSEHEDSLIPDGYTPDLGNVNDEQDTHDEIWHIKYRAYIIAGVGIAIVIIALAIGGFISNKGKASNKVDNVQNTQAEIKKQPVTIQGNTGELNVVNNQNSWIEISSDKELKFSESMSGTFTVTKIKHYVKETTLNEKEIKTVLVGSISGLTGTYELEVPYSQGVNLAIGNNFSISYKIGGKNEYSIISDIKY